MRIIVLLKQVPDTDEVKMDEKTGTMIREGLQAIINPLDLHALEEALRLKEKKGGEVVAISMGPPQTEEALREALAMGIDEAYLLSDRKLAGADTWATSKALSKAIEKLGKFDLILAGEKATDGETGQVGPEVSAMLDIPFSTYVNRVKEVTSEGLVVSRVVEEGYEDQFLPFPCLLTVVKDINEPRMPTLRGKIKARRAELKLLKADDLELSESEMGLKGSPTRVVKINYPKISRNAKIYSVKDLNKALDDLVDILKKMAVI
ncbi:MAG TPA: electron transfer flavoprotein beta subunit/FixA family protein [Thermotogaceae bacterium]|nr:electron transfer flavoprotein beta subunit/FixA family protein [Thermotogaceae bacterium]